MSDQSQDVLDDEIAELQAEIRRLREFVNKVRQADKKDECFSVFSTHVIQYLDEFDKDEKGE